MKKLIMLWLLFVVLSTENHAEIGWGTSPSGSLTSMPPASPALATPGDRSDSVPVKMTLAWQSQLHTSSYRVQVSAMSDFSTLAVNQNKILTTSFTAPSPLFQSTRYYWRVMAENAAGEGQPSTAWSFTTMRLAPQHFLFKSNTEDSYSLVIDAATVEGVALQPGDEVGVFTPAGLCVGAGVWPGTAPLAMAAWSDDSQTAAIDGYRQNEAMSFRIWLASASSTREYQASATYAVGNGLFSNGFYARISSLRSATSSQVTQKIGLRTGWNLISWNVDTTTDSTQVILKAIKSKVIVALGFESGGQTFDPNLPNMSTLPLMDHLHGYWLKMISADTLRLQGTAIDYTKTAIPCETGWNLISYLPSQPDSAAHAFTSVLNNMTFALGYNGTGQTFSPQLRLFNTLNVLSPGLGYWLKLNQPASVAYPTPLPDISSVRQNAAILARDDSRESPNLGGTVMPTNEWISLYGENIVYRGTLLAIGTEIKAKDQEGNECGYFIVRKAGFFGLMPVYRDDPYTDMDEGAKPGERISLFFGNDQVPVNIKWTEMGAILNVGGLLTSIQPETGAAPARFELLQNYPNPFNPATTVSFELPLQSHVTIRVINTIGQEIAVLLDQDMQAGTHQAIWNGKDVSGKNAASGLYFYIITAGEFEATKKMMLLY
jgi:hypothetical protein